MEFVVVYYNKELGRQITDSRVSKTKLLNYYDFGNYYSHVAQFVMKAGVGSHIELPDCTIFRAS